MKLSLAIKTLCRSTGKTLVTFLLVTAVTFALFSQVAEFAVTSREVQRARELYIGSGSVEVEPLPEQGMGPVAPMYILSDKRFMGLDGYQYEPLTQEQIEEIRKLPYVDGTDVRYMTPGVSDEYFRLDEGAEYYFYNGRIFIEATLTEISLNNQTIDGYGGGGPNIGRLMLADGKVIAGNVPEGFESNEWRLYSMPGVVSGAGGRIVSTEFADNYWDGEKLSQLEPGRRYLFVCRYDSVEAANHLENNSYLPLYLGDFLVSGDYEMVYDVTDEPENYLETEKFADLRELIHMTEEDNHTFDVVYTENMEAISGFVQDKMVMYEGRTLTPEDTERGNKVCVINQEMAEAYGLSVGDKLNLRLGTEFFEQYKGLGAIAGTKSRFSEAGTPVNLEIVGIYADLEASSVQALKPNWNYSINTVFVPSSLLPAEVPEEHMYSPSEVSFVVKSWNMDAFLEETAPRIEAMGITLDFNDGGWLAIKSAFDEAEKLAAVRISILAAAALVATGFSVYLFVSRRKKEYAIMRALGTAKAAAARTIAVPFMGLSVLSVVLGSTVGYIYITNTIVNSKTLAAMQGTEVNFSIPIWVALVCTLGVIIFTFAVTAVMLHRLSAMSPLYLLQDNSRAAKKKRRVETKREKRRVCAENTAVPDMQLLSALKLPTGELPKHKKYQRRFVYEYTLKHIRRTAWKSVLSVLLPAVLLCTAGQVQVSLKSYETICETTEVKSIFSGGLQLGSAVNFVTSGMASETYYNLSFQLYLEHIQMNAVITNDIVRYVDEEIDITYDDGYDYEIVSQLGNIVVVGQGLMETYDLSFGDKLYMMTEDKRDALYLRLASTYIRSHTDDPPDMETLCEMYPEDYNDTLEEFTVVGRLSTSSGNFENVVFMPGVRDNNSGFGLMLPMDYVEATLGDFRELDEFRAFGERISSANPEMIFVLDTEKLEAPLNTLNLLTKLYPTAVAAALVIGAFLCCLILLQSSKEASIMRVLGTTKGKTRAIMLWEQIFLCIIGLILGLAGLVIYNRGNILTVMGQLGIFAAAYLAVIVLVSLVTSTLIMRKDLLTLLQTKE